MISCGGGGGSGDQIGVSGDSGIEYVSENEVTIKGSFTGGIHAKNNWLKPILNLFTKDAMALDASYVSKVLIFTAGTYQYQATDVIDGSFTINISRNSNPIGMIFAGINNEYLGYLYLGENIASLPISRVESDVATIDLGDLSSSGIVVEPSNNPLGYEIPMTEEELKSLGQFNGLFAELIRNPDVDGNGVIDCLENKMHFMQLIYSVIGGYFDNTLTPVISTQLQQYNIAFVTNNDVCPDSVILEGPEGSRMYPPISINRFETGGPNCGHNTDFPFDAASMKFEVPAEGEYIITGYQDDVLTFRIPDQTAILDNMITIVPTFILDEDGYIQKINWIYRLADGSGPPLNPESITTQIQIIVYGNTWPPLYNSPMLDSSSTTEIDLSDRNILWNDVGYVGTSYTDVFGNGYGITWMKCDFDDTYCNR